MVSDAAVTTVAAELAISAPATIIAQRLASLLTSSSPFFPVSPLPRFSKRRWLAHTLGMISPQRREMEGCELINNPPAHFVL
jgi:hypothetical protein